jgi:hypothetical protein
MLLSAVENQTGLSPTIALAREAVDKFFLGIETIRPASGECDPASASHIIGQNFQSQEEIMVVAHRTCHRLLIGVHQQGADPIEVGMTPEQADDFVRDCIVALRSYPLVL